MGKFWVLMKLQWQGLLEYRGDLAIWTANNLLLPLFSLAAWLSLSGKGINLVLSRNDLVVYFLLVSLVEVLTGAWGGYFLSQQIIRGEFSMYLVKPLSVFVHYLSQNITEKIFKAFFMVIAIIIILVLFNNISFESLLNPLSLLLFIPSLGMAILATFLLDCTIGLLTFWVQDIDFLRSYIFIIEELLSGVLIPLVFFPKAIYQFLTFLPFRYFVSFPVEVITNRLTIPELIFGLSLQIFWTSLFFIMYHYVYQKGVKAYQAYGS